MLMINEPNSTVVPLTRIEKDQATQKEDQVVREVPVTLYLNEEEFVTLVCSPENLKELAIGFLCTEGILQKYSDLKKVTIDQESGIIWVDTNSSGLTEKFFLKRYLTSCCGRSRSSFYFVNDALSAKPVISSIKITYRQVLNLAACLEKRSVLFLETGGAHYAALCSPDQVLIFFEDIGRHNAVDKVFGRCFLERIDLEHKLLAISGRISSEILIKAGKMGVPLIMSRAAPTNLAIQMAEELGITVVGFVRDNRLNVYTHLYRVQ